MNLTPEQREQLRQAKDRGECRATIKFTAEQETAYREAVEREMADKEANNAHHLKIRAAAEQPGFFGDVRRAILLSRPSTSDLASKIGVEAGLFSDFRAGEAELPAAAMDRLIEILGLRLMHEIPR